MRKYLIGMVAAMCLGMSLVSAARAQNADLRAQRQQLKLRQKRERNVLKVQQQNIKQSWKDGHASSAVRTGAKRQMQRASRDMKQKQKDAMQDLKDHQRSLQAMQRANGQ
jgi:hypothetical protein